MRRSLHRRARPDPRPGDDGLRARQRAFAAALLDPDRAVPPGLVGPDGDPSAKRFAIYRNNVMVGLTEALAAAYPVVRRLVGADFFAAMGRIFASRQPPRSPIMLEYGAGFADFIAAFAPAAQLAYLPDVARLERAWVEAYHAAEARPLDPAALAALSPGAAPRTILGLHPSLRLVRSAFPVVTIWQMNVAGGVPAPVDPSAGGEDALVLRPAGEVEVRALPPGAAAFIAALAAGGTILEGAMAGLADHPRFDLGAALAGLVEAGAVTGWRAADDAADDAAMPSPAARADRTTSPFS